MAKKATRDTTTARIRYGQAKALASEYLGDPEFVEREFRKVWQLERSRGGAHALRPRNNIRAPAPAIRNSGRLILISYAPAMGRS